LPLASHFRRFSIPAVKQLKIITSKEAAQAIGIQSTVAGQSRISPNADD
jgi:hypothetical protein